jgi:hypothetical protein
MCIITLDKHGAIYPKFGSLAGIGGAALGKPCALLPPLSPNGFDLLERSRAMIGLVWN